MRLIRQFFEALEKLKEEKTEGVPSSVFRLKTESMYRSYFQRPASFFYEQDTDAICRYIRSEFPEEDFDRYIEMLGDLLCFDAENSEQTTGCSDLIRKALFFMEYADSHTDTYSFERKRKIHNLRTKIN